MGGKWGAAMKFAGYDGVIVQGKADKPVYVLLEGDNVAFKDASAIWGKGAIEAREMLKNEEGRSARVVGIGPAGENMAVMATIQADNDASGSGGLGAVMGSKLLKAIVVKSEKKKVKVAEPERLQELTKYFLKLPRIYARVEPILHNLVPDDMRPKMRERWKKPDPCFGCRGCIRILYEAEDGTSGKFMCHSGMFYQSWTLDYYGDWNDVPYQANKLIDTYGIDSKEMDLMVSWLHECHQAGLLSESDTGIPLSKIGSLEFMEGLVYKISFREGFGDLLAQGRTAAAASVGPEAEELASKAYFCGFPNHIDIYTPRLYLTHAIYRAMEPRKPMQQLHEVSFLMSKWLDWVKNPEKALFSSDVFRAIAKRFWGSELGADFSTYDGKGLAAKMIQDRETVKESLVVCDYLFPIMELASTEDHVGDPALESKILSAVTGNEVDEDSLNKIGSRIFNLQRAIMVREGHNGRDSDYPPEFNFMHPVEFDPLNLDCLVPGKDGEIFSRKGTVLDRKEYEGMRDEYYEIRQWDVSTGFQTKESLEDLDLSEVGDDLGKRGLIGKG
jgi:aldehyde:ferredoxin oxidoreductase